MTAKNILLTAPPYAVEQTLRCLGANLRTARLRRNLTLEAVAEKIGAGPRAVSHAEKGKPSASAAVYIALLWAYDLVDQMGGCRQSRKGRTWPDIVHDSRAYTRPPEKGTGQ